MERRGQMTLGAVQIAEKEAAEIMSKVMEKMFSGGGISSGAVAVKLDNHGPQHHIFTLAHDWSAPAGDVFGIETSIVVDTRVIVRKKNA
jgi:cysteine synthase